MNGFTQPPDQRLFLWRIVMIAIEVSGSIQAREFASDLNQAFLMKDTAISKLKRAGFRIYRQGQFLWDAVSSTESVSMEITQGV